MTGSILPVAALLRTVLLAVLALSAGTAAAERAPRVELSGIAPVRNLEGHFDYFLDASRRLQLADVVAPDFAGKFMTFRGKEPEFGYRKDNIWLRLGVTNRAGTTDSWKIDFHTNFMHGIDAYVVAADGSVTHILEQDHLKPFWTRPLAYPQLVADFTLRKGETVDIYVRYWSDGFTGLRPTIESARSFETVAFRNTAKAFLVQGILALLVLAGIAAFVVTRSLTPLAYGLYLLSGSLYVLHVDGYAFQYLWPGLPLFNGIASLFIGACLTMSGANYVRVFLNTRRYNPWFDKILLGYIIFPFAMVLSATVIDTQTLKKTMILVASSSTLFFFAAGVNAARHRFKQVRFFILGWFGVILSAGLMSGRHLFGIEISRELTLDSMRVVLVFDALMMGLALLDRFQQIRSQQRQVLMENLAVTQRNLDMHERLARLERRYAEVSELAQNRGRRIADVSHDLRQPIHALRLAVQQAVNSQQAGQPAPDSIGRTFDYLENLVERNLSASLLAETEEAPRAGDSGESPGFSCSLVLQQVREMFEGEAVTKGLSFRYVPCSVQVSGDPMALMRAVANLVSNAVKYTNKGGLLLGCRRRGDRLSIEVHDSGPGLAPDELRELRRRNARKRPDEGDPGGAGLGLAIVEELAGKHGWVLRTQSEPGRGSVFAIEVPVATDERRVEAGRLSA